MYRSLQSPSTGLFQSYQPHGPELKFLLIETTGFYIYLFITQHVSIKRGVWAQLGMRQKDTAGTKRNLPLLLSRMGPDANQISTGLKI